MDQKTIEVVVIADTWDVGGKVFKQGEKLLINAATLVKHVSAGRCVPVGKEKEFARINELRVKAQQAESRAIAEAKAEVAALTGEIENETRTLVGSGTDGNQE